MTSSMATVFVLLIICAGNSPVTGEFPAQRAVTWSFDAFFDLRLNKRLSKQSWGWWFETPSRALWRHCNVYWDLRFVCGNTMLHEKSTITYFSYKMLHAIWNFLTRKQSEFFFQCRECSVFKSCNRIYISQYTHLYEHVSQHKIWMTRVFNRGG